MDSDEHELTKAEDKMVSENAREQPITAKVEAAQLQRPEHEVGAIVQQPLAPGGVRPSETSLAVSVEPNQINALECPACEASSRSGIVYALGQIDYDFGTEGTRDSLVQSGLSNPHDPGQLLAYLERSPSHATALIWTLTQEGTPIYAIQPAGAFAADIYGRLREFLQGQLNEGVERCSIPGVLGGKATLLNGQVVPIIYPELRGMYSWNTSALVRAVCGEPVGESAAAKERDAYMHKTQAVQNFLERVYYEVRNIGVMPQERAMNCAVTNASNAEKIFESALKEGKELDAIEVERSPIGRPGSECWDVKLTFFNPSRRLDQARRVYRFCIDVSNPIPVTVGNVRQWHVY